jgi:hypothetical protein
VNFLSLNMIVAMLAKNYGAKECYGLDISSHQINYASTRFDDVENLHYITVIFKYFKILGRCRKADLSLRTDQRPLWIRSYIVARIEPLHW